MSLIESIHRKHRSGSKFLIRPCNDIVVEMQLIRCTKKLQKRLSLSNDEFMKHESSGDILGPWHANLIAISGSPAILFANDRTLLNFFIDINPHGPVHHFHKNFVAMVSCLLADLGVRDATREYLIQEYTEIGFAPTNNRRVLGSMNDLAFHYDCLVSEAGGIHSADVPRIIRDLNGMPMSMLPEGAPDRELKQMVAELRTL